MTPLRILTAELAARRLVAKGHLTPRSLTYEPSPRPVESLGQGEMSLPVPVSEGRGGEATNPFLDFVADRRSALAAAGTSSSPARGVPHPVPAATWVDQT